MIRPSCFSIDQRARQLGAVAWRVEQLAEQPGAQIVIDRPAVVGIDQAEIPELVALVDVGHARRGQLQQRLRQRVERAEVRDLAPGRLRKSARKRLLRRVLQDRGDERAHRLVVGGVRVEPAGVDLGLADGLDHVGLDALDELRRRTMDD